MSRPTLTLATATALTSGLALLLSACGGGSSSSSAPKPQQTRIAATANQINPVDPAKLKQGGTLNFPVDQYSTQWNVYNADSQNELSVVNTMAPLLPSLFHSSAANVLSANTDYLVGVDNQIKDGKQTTTYQLNPKGRWSDGTPIGWKDFEAVWRSSNGKDSHYSATSTTGYDQIASVAMGKDQFEVVVTYASPFADWQSLFSPLYPASQIGTLNGFNTSYKNHIPVTGGPFKVQSMNPTTKVVTEVRDPAWWGAKPVLDQINFRTIDGATEPGAFASGEIDVTNIGPSVDAYKRDKTVGGSSIRVAGAPNLRQLLLNGQSPALTDQNVRQAVFQGINRTAIGQSDLSGLPWKIEPLNNHFLVNNAEGYSDNAGALGSYDPKAAAAKLDAAGWKTGGNGYRSKDGKELDLTLEIPAGTPVATNESQLLVPMMKAIGVKLSVRNGAADQFFNDIEAGKFDMTIFSGIGAVPFFPLTNSEATFLAPTSAGVGQNYSRLGSPALDAQMRKAGTEIDHKAYLADITAADKMLWELAVNLPLYQRPAIEGTKSTLANYGAFGFQDTDWTKIGFTG